MHSEGVLFCLKKTEIFIRINIRFLVFRLILSYLFFYLNEFMKTVSLVIHVFVSDSQNRIEETI